MNTKHIRRQ